MVNGELLVVRTGTANTASVLAGLARLGCEARMTRDPAEITAASRVVLPGVGAFAAAMEQLRGDGVEQALIERVEQGRPLLAVCLGLQLLALGSEESPDGKGLGVLPGRVRRFPESVCVPQLGWNRVEPDERCRWLRPGHAYFANSYRLEAAPPGWSAAYARHGGRFVAALERGGVLACQFHPELSGAWGLDLLRRWLESTASEGGR